MKRFLIFLMAAVILMGGTVSAFAMDYPATLPALPDDKSSLDHYVIIQNDDVTTLFHLSVDNLEDVTAKLVNSSYMDFYASALVSYQWYELNLEENKWSWVNSNTISAGDKARNSLGLNSEFVYSTLDIYDANNELVFPVPPVPLAEEIREVAEETLTVETMPNLNRTVSVVVLCGVGCLALLTSLILLPKVLRRFLG